MAGLEDIQRELTRRRVQEALEARQGGGFGDTLRQGLERVAPVMPGPALALGLMDDPAALPEAVGAMGGAALGAPLGGVGAMAGGAGGAALGRTLGELLFEGELPTRGEVGTAAAAGAAGPALGGLFRHTARIFAKLPTVRAAVGSAQAAAQRQTQALKGGQLERMITTTAHDLDNDLAELTGIIARHRASGTAPEAAAKAAEAAVGRFAEVVPRQVARILTAPAVAIARGAAAVPPPGAPAGSVSGALGALAGGAYAGMEGAVGAGAFGFLFGQVRGAMAYALANNPRFVSWATGLIPRSSVAQGALAFTGSVLLQSEGDEERVAGEDFFELMMEFIQQFPAEALGIGAAEGAEQVPEQFTPPGSTQPIPLPPTFTPRPNVHPEMLPWENKERERLYRERIQRRRAGEREASLLDLLRA